MNTLRQAKIGDTVKVVKLHGEGAVKQRGRMLSLRMDGDLFPCKKSEANSSY